MIVNPIRSTMFELSGTPQDSLRYRTLCRIGIEETERLLSYKALSHVSRPILQRLNGEFRSLLSRAPAIDPFRALRSTVWQHVAFYEVYRDNKHTSQEACNRKKIQTEEKLRTLALYYPGEEGKEIVKEGLWALEAL